MLLSPFIRSFSSCFFPPFLFQCLGWLDSVCGSSMWPCLVPVFTTLFSSVCDPSWFYKPVCAWLGSDLSWTSLIMWDRGPAREREKRRAVDSYHTHTHITAHSLPLTCREKHSNVLVSTKSEVERWNAMSYTTVFQNNVSNLYSMSYKRPPCEINTFLPFTFYRGSLIGS